MTTSGLQCICFVPDCGTAYLLTQSLFSQTVFETVVQHIIIFYCSS